MAAVIFQFISRRGIEFTGYVALGGARGFVALGLGERTQESACAQVIVETNTRES